MCRTFSFSRLSLAWVTTISGFAGRGFAGQSVDFLRQWIMSKRLTWTMWWGRSLRELSRFRVNILTSILKKILIQDIWPKPVKSDNILVCDGKQRFVLTARPTHKRTSSTLSFTVIMSPCRFNDMLVLFCRVCASLLSPLKHCLAGVSLKHKLCCWGSAARPTSVIIRQSCLYRVLMIYGTRRGCT